MLKEKTKAEQTENDNAEIKDDFTVADLLNNHRKLRIVNIIAVRIFTVLFFVVFVFALIIPLRPNYSETEKRELSKFPKFSLTSFATGEYFKGIDNWYADTFPAREKLTSFNKAYISFLSMSKTKISGNVVKGDEIPTADASSDSSKQEQTAEPTENPVVSEPEPEQTVTSQTLGALLINGDAAFEYYNFSQAAADIYTNALNRAGTLFNGKAYIYDIIVPTGMGIIAPDELTASVNTSNQKDAIDYIYSRVGNGVRCVPIYNTLRNHRNEYLYFRTDHHWTSLGAYYAYDKLMRCMNVEPCSLESYAKYEFPGFLGTFYNSCKLPQLAENPDTVIAYGPPQTNAISIFNGAWYDSNIISDVSQGTAGGKYLTFIKGDQPLSYIVNPELADGSVCIVIKESYGNAFVPFLVPHYQTVYIVDYRHIAKVDPRGLVQLQAETGARDIIFINNISATRNKSLMAMIDSYVR